MSESPHEQAQESTGVRVGVVVMAYGTPASPDDIEEYYTDIRRGRPPSPEQLADLVGRYQAIGGVSPLAARTEAQRAAIETALDRIEPGRYRVVLGQKHASPTIEDAVDQLAGDGIAHVVGVVLAPHYSSVSIGQYLERLEHAATEHHMESVGIRSWATESSFVQHIADDLRRRLDTMPGTTAVLFTAHSLPSRVIAAGDPYPDELRSTAVAVAELAGLIEHEDWQIAWQSAGRTPEPWLGPDILEVIDSFAARPERPDGVLVAAVGFVADHLEVLYDLDIEARGVAEDHGLAFDRTSCVNDETAVMTMLAERVDELTHERFDLG